TALTVPEGVRPMRRRTTRAAAGLTLVEVLVVIAIIAVLLGLVLPAVQHAREAANRARCQNNLHQLGLALHQYHDVQGQLPAARLDLPAPHTWVPSILPYLELKALFDLYRFDRPWDDPANQPVVQRPLPVLLCPSARPFRALDIDGRRFAPL